MMILGTEWLDIQGFPFIGDRQAFHLVTQHDLLRTFPPKFSRHSGAVVRC